MTLVQIDIAYLVLVVIALTLYAIAKLMEKREPKQTPYDDTEPHKMD